MRKLTKYGAIFRAQLQNSAAYPLDLLSRSLSIVLFMWIFFNLWRAAYASTGGGAIAGLTLSDTLWYLMIAETIMLSRPRLAQTIAAQVKDGSIAYLLNKPYSFLLYHVAVAMGDGLTRVVSNLLAGGAVVWLVVGPPPALWGWPLTLAALLLGWLIDFCLTALIGMSAFVAEDVSAFEWIYNKLLMILGGLLIPLDFFPGWLQAIARSLPFAAAVYGPARLFVSPDPAAFLGLVATQLGWLAGLGGLLFLVYRRAEGWLSINGG
jgi:ABC-2 type transport system permease protein